MKHTLFVLLLVSSIGAQAQDIASTAATASTQAENDLGCLGQTLNACIDRVHQYITISYDDTQSQRQRNSAVDVNGRPVVKKKSLTLIGTISGSPAGAMSAVTIDYNVEETVTSVQVQMAGDASMAETSDDYDKTGLFEAVQVAIGTRCSQMSRMALYQFFENKVKPRMVVSPTEREVNMDSASETYGKTAKGLVLCGHPFEYVLAFGHDTNDIDIESNPSGAWMSASITMTQ